MREIPVVICIDVEPNSVEPDPASREPWSGFVATAKYFSALRAELESITKSPVNFSWMIRMDPQVEVIYGSANWVAIQHSEQFAELAQQGDELGLHIHATRWDNSDERWKGDYGNQRWVAECVTTAFQNFEKTFKRKCKSVSIGDRWGNHETMDLIEELGADYFLSIEPGVRPRGEELPHEFTGTWPDFSRAPYAPYIPATHDYLKSEANSGRKLWMIPLSAGKYDGPQSLRWPRLKHVVKTIGVDLQRDQESTVLRMHLPPESFCRTVDGLLKISQTPYLSFVLRAEVCIDPLKLSNLEKNVNFLKTHELATNLRFVTPARLIEMLHS